jgi:RecG-like helicase
VTVGLKDLAKRLTSSVEDLDKARLQTRYEGLDLTHIGECPTRRPVRVGGEVTAMQVVPRAGSPWLEVTISDGSGRAIAMFTGRRRIGGLEPGRGVLLEGVCRKERNRTVLLNPAYTLLPDS